MCSRWPLVMISMLLLILIYCLKTECRLTSDKQCRLNHGYTARGTGLNSANAASLNWLSLAAASALHVKDYQCLSWLMVLDCASLKYGCSLHMMPLSHIFRWLAHQEAHQMPPQLQCGHTLTMSCTHTTITSCIITCSGSPQTMFTFV